MGFETFYETEEELEVYDDTPEEVRRCLECGEQLDKEDDVFCPLCRTMKYGK